MIEYIILLLLLLIFIYLLFKEFEPQIRGYTATATATNQGDVYVEFV